jgi:hypothetical protein
LFRCFQTIVRPRKVRFKVIYNNYGCEGKRGGERKICGKRGGRKREREIEKEKGGERIKRDKREGIKGDRVRGKEGRKRYKDRKGKRGRGD